MSDPVLLGTVANLRSKPEYIVDTKPIQGKFMALAGKELYGPFDTPEQAVEWAASRVKT